MLPKPIGPDKEVVGLFRPGVYDPSKYSMLDIMATSHTVQKVCIFNVY